MYVEAARALPETWYMTMPVCTLLLPSVPQHAVARSPNHILVVWNFFGLTPVTYFNGQFKAHMYR
jgi:hypothetical protein